MKFFVTLALIVAFVCAALAQDLSVHPDLTQPLEDVACNITHSDLTTSDPPSLLIAQSGFLTLDTLTLTMRVSKRYVTAHANMSGAIGDFCSLAFSVAADSSPCTVLVTAAISWSDAQSKCGVYLDTSATGDHLVFRGSILLDLTETDLPQIRSRSLSRLVHSVFPFLLRFPTTVSTSHSINTYFPVTLDAAIIRQFDIRTPAATTTAQSNIRLFTSVQYPFYLTAPTWVGSPSFTTHDNSFTIEPVTQTTAYLLSGESCQDVSGNSCEQEWIIVFDAAASPPVCDFSVVATLGFTVRCQSGEETTCPLPFVTADSVHEAPASVVLTINTENFCPQIFADVPATATLASYQDALLTIPKNDFLQGATIYFLATSASTKATIVGTSVDTVTLDFGTTHDLLYDAAAPSSVFVTLGAHGATTAAFSVPLNAATFPVPLDGSVQFTFTVVLNLVFANTAGVVRVTQIFNPFDDAADSAVSGHPVDVAQTVSIGASPVDAPAASSSAMATNTLIYIIAGSCVGVILFATMAVIIRRRVAAKKSTTEMTGASAGVTGATTIV